MNDKRWIHVKSEDDVDLKLFTARFEYLINPRNDKEVKVVRLHSRDSCNAVCITGDNRLVLVHQMRFGTMEYSLELPGGLLDPGELPLEAIKRELAEETGYVCSKWTALPAIFANSVYMDSRVYHFLAEQGELTLPLQLDDAEDIKVRLLTIEETLDALRNGYITHPHSISALSYLFMFHPQYKGHLLQYNV